MGKQGNGIQGASNYPLKEDRGSTLHREFVGMVFALAIGQVAIEGAPIANSDLSFIECFPAYAHLALVTLFITTSWIGWGRSRQSESDVKSAFSRDFLELLVDLWLVMIYFFITKGVDANTNVTPIVITASLQNEKFWIFIAFVSYVAWDFLTKCKKDHYADLRQRVWASIICAFLAMVAWMLLPNAENEYYRVLLGDLTLAILVLLFRAMKANDISKLTGWQKTRIVAFVVLFAACAVAVVKYDVIEGRLLQPAAAPALPPAPILVPQR